MQLRVGPTPASGEAVEGHTLTQEGLTEPLTGLWSCLGNGGEESDNENSNTHRDSSLVSDGTMHRGGRKMHRLTREPMSQKDLGSS
jgi:hypothetical protein